LKISPPQFDGENPYQDEMTQLRIDRLGHRLTLLSVLLPIAIVVILALGYLDLKGRVIGLQDSGAASVQTLSDDLMSRFSTLSVRVAELEAKVEKSASEGAAQQTAHVDRIAKIEARLKALEADKLNRQQLQATIETIAQQVAALTERIGGQDAALKTATERINGQMQAAAESLIAVETSMAALTAAIEPIKKNQAALDTEVKRLGAALKTDREASQQALGQQKEATSRQIQQLVQPLEARLETLRRKVEQLQRDMAAAQAPARPRVPATSPSTAPRGTVSPPQPPPSTAPATPDIEPGQIIEKPLQ
jgi:chromosome segregation ATPase